ncbi:aminoglycoside phosphotransferase [Paenibacillus ihbetae]|uniref:Aminoglycoside phosphotransferase n=1 Tax=Paenibacillus ihbetae TaxID=1870820 RepID=A0A1B2DVI3_9BACL|nr:phosphotransferase [Paenibacillus ihbetae]ANY71726.1 aminoglycoside phosphotransferase [Paenibacillus ihbetae]
MIERLIQQCWPEWVGTVSQGAGGWNNTTCFIHQAGRGCVLRIYNTHRDKDKIEFELDVLESLRHSELSFETPMPIPSATGERIVQIPDGSERYAVVFEFLEGQRPEGNSLLAAYSFGEKTGELVEALGQIDMVRPPVYRPYHELLQSYPACTREAIEGFCLQPEPAFLGLHQELRQLLDAYDDISRRLGALRKLPQQLVHGDLNFSNLLVDPLQPEKVTALLDFEFCTRDVRVVEPAVVISGFLGLEGEHEAISRFCQGFGSRIRLNAEEIEAIPVLIRLRMVDVFLHFLSRYREGTDDAAVLQEQVRILSSGLRQLTDSVAWIREAAARYLL